MGHVQQLRLAVRVAPASPLSAALRATYGTGSARRATRAAAAASASRRRMPKVRPILIDVTAAGRACVSVCGVGGWGGW